MTVFFRGNLVYYKKHGYASVSTKPTLPPRCGRQSRTAMAHDHSDPAWTALVDQPCCFCPVAGLDLDKNPTALPLVVAVDTAYSYRLDFDGFPSRAGTLDSVSCVCPLYLLASTNPDIASKHGFASAMRRGDSASATLASHSHCALQFCIIPTFRLPD